MIKLTSLIENVNSPLTVYHGTNVKFNKFSLTKSTMGIIWFTSDKNKILNKDVGASGHGFIVTANVTIKNPAGWDEYEKFGLSELLREGYDGVILPDETGFDCFVFSPKQIKILKVEKI